jgi:hypothetical protein
MPAANSSNMNCRRLRRSPVWASREVVPIHTTVSELILTVVLGLKEFTR